MSYQYTECGLSYVYLNNGYRIDDSEWGKVVAIEHVADLHRTIGKGIIDSPNPLSGSEFKFLRAELGMSQKYLSILGGYSDNQIVKQWEKQERGIPLILDTILRTLYRERIINHGGSTNISALLEKLSDHEQAKFHQRRVEFSEEDGIWQAQAA